MIESICKDNELTILIYGRVDSTNALTLEEEIREELTKCTFQTLVIDMTNTSYISSAGLRVLLKLIKSHPTLKITNTSQEVYNVFEMTGFTEIASISKALRQLSVDNCDLIGFGANGKVYRLDPETVIKVYSNPDSLADINRERELARRAFVLGIPTAIPYDVVKVGNLYGSVFELLNAKSFAQLIAESRENIDLCLNESVSLLKKIHSIKVPTNELPKIKTIHINLVNSLKDYLPLQEYNKLLSLIEAVPDENTMLHGDFHVKNIMFQDNESFLIDMDTICTGNPIFEFGSICFAYQCFSENNPQDIKDFFGFDFETAQILLERTFKIYFNDIDQTHLSAIIKKSQLVAYIQKMEHFVRHTELDESKRLFEIESCKSAISCLVKEIDTLAI